MSREEHMKQLHQCIHSYIEYLQTKNDVTEQQSDSSEVNVVQVDTGSLLNVFNQPLRQLASDLNLNVTRSVTDAFINAGKWFCHYATVMTVFGVCSVIVVTLRK